MHEAYEVSSLLTVTVQIEAIAAYDGNLLLGTRQGHLLMYSLSTTNNGNPSQGKYSLQLLRYCKNFSKKPIQQIDVIPEKNLLLCLSDNVLAIHDINGVNFPLIDTFQQTKGASLFALDNKSTTSITGESNSVVRLCVAVRRKLQLYTGTNGKFKQHLFDFTMPDVPKVMAWGQEYICVGFKSEYTLYDLSSGKAKELFPAGSSKSLDPTIAQYSETSFLLGRDQTSVLVEEAKNIEIKKTIKWSEPPISVVWDEPYILGLLQEQIVVQTIEPPLFIQTISELNKARLMYRCKRGLIFVSSVGQVWCLSSVDVTKQRNQLLKDKQFHIAIDLTESKLSWIKGYVRQLQNEALYLSPHKVFERLESQMLWSKLATVTAFNQNLSECSKEEKEASKRSILTLYAHELFDIKEYSKSMKEFLKLNTNPTEVIALFPDLDGKSESKHKLKGKDLENALKALIDYLLELRRRYGGTDKIEDGNDDGDKRLSQAGGSREEGSGVNVQQQLELIDTTLLKCYLQTNDALVASLLRLNNCRLEDAERTLQQHGKYSELIILYQTKGQHTKALQLLREQAKQPDSSLKGYSRTKMYLQNLGAEHINLIFKFSDWILKEHPEEGLKIFTEDKIEVENLPRPKILDFLLREHDALVIPYLEHVIHTWNDTNSIFHDALISMYREKITTKKANLTEEELQHTKSKLISFLEKSVHYTPERVILHFPNDSLFEERAIILGKLGRHEQALAIYVQILGDVDRAIRYCENTCQSSKDTNQDVYVILMKILVNPEQSAALSGPLAKVPRHPDTAEPDLETALDILEKHGDNISVLKALSVLPDSVPLPRLARFLQSSLSHQLALKRRTQLLKGLLYADHMQVQEQKQFHESKSVVINDYNVCPVCKKRFGNQSAFVRYPNGDIVHYSCRLDK